jgi:formate hydrogenlyase subunit 6/NADH:ubiquinone oxidoreductase subunit I
MAKKRPVFEYRTCMACGICEQTCPLSCIAMNKTDVDAYKKAYPILFVETRCTGCSLCQKACPVDAIKMSDMVVLKEVA